MSVFAHSQTGPLIADSDGVFTLSLLLYPNMP